MFSVPIRKRDGKEVAETVLGGGGQGEVFWQQGARLQAGRGGVKGGSVKRVG